MIHFWRSTLPSMEMPVGVQLRIAGNGLEMKGWRPSQNSQPNAGNDGIIKFNIL
jgi:hypothetical protein